MVDCPPANIISDASVLGRLADGVLLVARSGVTDSAALASAVEQLTRVGVTVTGVVLNDIDFKKESRYDSAYRSYESQPLPQRGLGVLMSLPLHPDQSSAAGPATGARPRRDLGLGPAAYRPSPPGCARRSPRPPRVAPGRAAAAGPRRAPTSSSKSGCSA